MTRMIGKLEVQYTDPKPYEKRIEEIRAELKGIDEEWKAWWHAGGKNYTRAELDASREVFKERRQALYKEFNDLEWHLAYFELDERQRHSIDKDGREHAYLQRFRAVIGYPSGCCYDIDILAANIKQAAWYAARQVGHFADRPGHYLISVYESGKPDVETLPPLPAPPDPFDELFERFAPDTDASSGSELPSD